MALIPMLLSEGSVSGPLAAQAPLLQRVSWLSGCWVRELPGRRIEELWLPPRGGAMLNLGRTIRDDRMTDYEFVLLREADGTLAYEAHPAGQSPATFLAAEPSESLVVFTNPTHDFPQEVGYRRMGTDSLLAWIAGSLGGNPRRIEFPYRRVSCDVP